MAHTPFNPLDKRNLGESVAAALLRRPVGPLPPEHSFLGAGIYAIYYTGRFGPYGPVTAANEGKRFGQPIYVGKAVPPGARKGGFGLGSAPGNVLYARLRQHAHSISEAHNLLSADFSCRYLTSDDIWIPLGEALLIEQFKPLWNVLIEGFGNHPTGKRRETQFRSRWDTIHPGRPWADRLPPNPTSASQLRRIIADFFAGRGVPTIPTEEAVTGEEE
jgi:hypothetical protein